MPFRPTGTRPSRFTAVPTKATGTAAFNQKLSEKRMQYVYDLLVNKYGSSKERLKTVAEGDAQPLPEPELNRTESIME